MFQLTYNGKLVKHISSKRVLEEAYLHALNTGDAPLLSAIIKNRLTPFGLIEAHLDNPMIQNILEDICDSRDDFTESVALSLLSSPEHDWSSLVNHSALFSATYYETVWDAIISPAGKSQAPYLGYRLLQNPRVSEAGASRIFLEALDGKLNEVESDAEGRLLRTLEDEVDRVCTALFSSQKHLSREVLSKLVSLSAKYDNRWKNYLLEKVFDLDLSLTEMESNVQLRRKLALSQHLPTEYVEMLLFDSDEIVRKNAETFLRSL